jgi:hypothetical protein
VKLAKKRGFERFCVRSTDVPQVDTASGIAWNAFDGLLPPQTGFGGDHLFNDFFSFTL